MGEATAIAWCDATVNFWWGCTRVSAACDFCYAETWAKRLGKDIWGHGKPRQQIKGATALAFKLERKAVREGRRIKVFSNSMSDFFDSEVPDEWRDRAMAVIALTPHLDWLVLTKRTKVARAYLTSMDQARADGRGEAVLKLGYDGPLELLSMTANLWLGVTAEDQKMADLRIPELLATPAARRFVSMEPLLGPVDLGAIRRSSMPWHPPGPGEALVLDALVGQVKHLQQGRAIPETCPRLDWVIVGGESGPKARTGHIDHHRSIIEQCRAAGVPVFEKQLGRRLRMNRSDAVQPVGLGAGWRAEKGAAEGVVEFRDRAGADPAEWPADLRVQEFPA